MKTWAEMAAWVFLPQDKTDPLHDKTFHRECTFFVLFWPNLLEQAGETHLFFQQGLKKNEK